MSIFRFFIALMLSLLALANAEGEWSHAEFTYGQHAQITGVCYRLNVDNLRVGLA
jgi:hypothetical protein